MRGKQILVSFGLLVVSAFLLGQGIPLSTLTGKVTVEDGAPLPGVTVAVESPNLQGKRQVSTSSTGDYLFNLLPPGDYAVTFALQGMQTVKKEITLAAAGTGRIDQTMQPAAVKESMTVSAEAQAATPLGTTQVSANYKQKLIEKLPLDRTLRSVTLLAAGVNDNGPKGSTGSANERSAITISGAQSFENLFLINGVVINENLRGQPQDLFIEDAIQETTVLTGSISAEYGRFTGGVVNAITRSGGNQFHGSFRTTFTNDKWTANNPWDERLRLDNRVDELSKTYEATLGGPVWRDRIWFFGAGRQATLSDSRSTSPTFRTGDENNTPIPYVHGTDEWRLEGKLTSAITPRHNLIASYIAVRQDETNFAFNTNILDTAGSLIPIRRPNSLLAVNYNGVLAAQFFVEAQYSRRKFTIEQGGAIATDRIAGTRIFDGSRFPASFHSPQAVIFTPQHYDNESWLVKGSYFLSQPSIGSHDLRVGYERFAESAVANVHITGSDFRINATSAIIRGTQVFPVFRSEDVIRWRPIFQESHGTDLVTNSAFVNDRFEWNKHWSFSIGLRYDKNDDKDSRGFTVSHSGSWSPRLVARYDPGGDGRFEIDAGYGRYAAKIHDNLANASSPAGQEATLEWTYLGPCVNCNVNAPTSELIPTDQALQILFDWFESIGGIRSKPTSAKIPGLSTRIAEGGLKSPNVKEYSFGVGAALGHGGYVKADFLYRNFDDFYSSRIDRSTGQSPPDQYGNVLDMEVIGNSSRLDRRYTAVQTQLQYRFTENLHAGGSYTWSRLTGNLGGESRAFSADPGFVEQYPEYKQERWNYPTGYISSGFPLQFAGDQRHRARLWIGWDLTTRFGDLDLSLLESYDSGQPYQAVGAVDPRKYVANPGYKIPPKSVSYFFTKPAAFRTDNITRTDVALNYSIRVAKSLELFVRPEVLNVFNEKGVVAVDTNVLTRVNAGTGFARFNPFTDTPVRGPANEQNPTANYDLGPDFGKPTSAAGYQLPRTFRVGVGLRF